MGPTRLWWTTARGGSCAIYLIIIIHLCFKVRMTFAPCIYALTFHYIIIMQQSIVIIIPASRTGRLHSMLVSTCTVINPRRACAARITVVVLSFCLSVCLLPRFLPLRATRRPISDTNGFSATLASF